MVYLHKGGCPSPPPQPQDEGQGLVVVNAEQLRTLLREAVRDVLREERDAIEASSAWTTTLDTACQTPHRHRQRANRVVTHGAT